MQPELLPLKCHFCPNFELPALSSPTTDATTEVSQLALDVASRARSSYIPQDASLRHVDEEVEFE